ncbi:hypothetical protein BGZ83_009848 [Gryganskiella cystojenkinii]|nr:hypothetical protein BGZ83_009848 [Gryganskiella cystojenkinii]
MEENVIMLRGQSFVIEILELLDFMIILQTIMEENVISHRVQEFRVKANQIFMEEKVVMLRGRSFGIKILELLGFMWSFS